VTFPSNCCCLRLIRTVEWTVLYREESTKKMLHNSRYAAFNELVLGSFPLVWLQSCQENVTLRSLEMIRQTSAVNFHRFTESRADVEKKLLLILYMRWTLYGVWIICCRRICKGSVEEGDIILVHLLIYTNARWKLQHKWSICTFSRVFIVIHCGLWILNYGLHRCTVNFVE